MNELLDLLVGFGVWLVLWRVRFVILENVFGMLGLAMIVFAVAVWQLGPDWGRCGPRQAIPRFRRPKARRRTSTTR